VPIVDAGTTAAAGAITPLATNSLSAGRMQRDAAGRCGDAWRGSIKPRHLHLDALDRGIDIAAVPADTVSSPRTCHGSIACRSSVGPFARNLAQERKAKLEVRREPFVLERIARAAQLFQHVAESCCTKWPSMKRS